jgi:hypothetical protein
MIAIALGSAVIVVVVLFIVTASANRYRATISVRNDTGAVVRLSSCVDDSLDLDPGQSWPIDVNSERTGCYVYRNGVYLGCLSLTYQETRVALAAPLIRHESQKVCDSGG